MSVRMILGAAALAAMSLAGVPEGHADKQYGGTGSEVKRDVKDSWLTAKTKIALYSDDRISGTKVNVDTRKGVVTLRGKVPTEAARMAAAEVARGIEGVKNVRNELQVVPASRREAVEDKDEAITDKIEKKLSREVRGGDIDVRTDAGVVTLTGHVPDIVQSALASEAAWDVPGVKTVKNELNVK